MSIRAHGRAAWHRRLDHTRHGHPVFVFLEGDDERRGDARPAELAVGESA